MRGLSPPYNYCHGGPSGGGEIFMESPLGGGFRVVLMKCNFGKFSLQNIVISWLI